MAKRGRLEIMRDIMGVINDSNNSIRPTPLLRKSNLSSVRFKQYFFELVNKKCVGVIGSTRGDKKIYLTEKGFKFLERYKTIVNFIDEFDL